MLHIFVSAGSENTVSDSVHISSKVVVEKREHNTTTVPHLPSFLPPLLGSFAL